MSPKRSKDVPQIVEKYRTKFPSSDRDVLRKLIRLENPGLFLKNASNLKKLDRHLRKAFETDEPSSSRGTIAHPLLKKTLDDAVEKALVKLARKQSKTTSEEVASKIGIPFSNIEQLVYQIVQKHRWKTSKTKFGEVEIDFNKPFDPNAIRLGPVHDPWRPYNIRSDQE